MKSGPPSSARRPVIKTAPFALLAFAALSVGASAQEAPESGLRRVDPRWHALVHATVIPRPGETIEDATVVVRDGVIVSVQAGAVPPDGARVWDCSGLTVYPGLVETHVPVEAPRAPGEANGHHWLHGQVTPQRSALDGAGIDEAVRKELREMGFAVAAIAPSDGVVRGRGAVVSLGEPRDDVSAATAEVLAAEVYQEIAFQSGGFRGRDAEGPRYPTSQMGAIALVRQTLLDADHYRDCHEVYTHDPTRHEPPQRNHAMDALDRGSNGGTPILFNARAELEILRAARVAEEFGRPMIVLGCGTEFRRLDAIAEADLPIILPLDYPDEPDVSTRAKAEGVSLRDLMTWEQAPTNPRRLVEAGVIVALTTDKGSRDEFFDRVRQAMKQGLDEADVLAMLTTTPARILGLEDRVGEVAPGMLANLVVADGAPFAEETEIRDVWVGGRRYEVNAAPGPDHTGVYDVTFAGLGGSESLVGRLTVAEGNDVKFTTPKDVEVDATGVELEGTHLHFRLDGEELGVDGVLSCSGIFEGDDLYGSLTGPDGSTHRWSATRTSDEVADADADADTEEEGEGDEDAGPGRERGLAHESVVPEHYGTPFGAYGLAEVPSQRTVRVEGATIWTSSGAGILEDGVLVVEDGRVAYVGPADGAPSTEGAEVIDATGKHVTPGIIDCHSHTGISGGVNEMGRRVTAEVRISDVIDPDRISYYRQLAGGLTAANQLHGSGNAIGGQNSVVKNRWGSTRPDDLRLTGAPGGIKFALGENPKRTAAGSDEYPQTRMGVEALIRDRLSAGRDYNVEWAAYDALSEWERRDVMPPRRDLELEAMGEIVAGTRLIHSHSYRQDEILMLARLAQEFGVTIGTFQHVLEGYKVAEAVAEAALGASTFSDWWAYKFEVIDAIPQNAAIMTEVGVVVSINSDSDEHARRLNTEAGKSVKHGGMDPHDALKLVTLNPAIQLGVADRVGSLEAGKDADFAIWSGDPLSYYSRCESTWIDGREYFSLETDRELRAEAQSERHRIIQKILAGDGSSKKGRGGRSGGRFESPTTLPEEILLELEAMLRAGIDPELAQPGDCGCSEVHQALSSTDR